MQASSAASALRESFGDRKLPDISRKITACVACRKVKIKCRMTDDKPPCTRCRAQGLGSTVNKSLQAPLENDASWKEIIEKRLAKVEESLNLTPDSVDSTIVPNPRSNTPKAISASTNVAARASELTDDVALNLSGSLGAFPASSITSRAPAAERATTTSCRPDLISCGMISIEAAEICYTFNKTQLDPYIHVVLAKSDSLADIRARSSILTAAVCTFSSFFTGSKDYKACLNAYRDEFSRKFFRHSVSSAG